MWEGWPLSKVILLFTGIAMLLISLQVTLYHYRQNFRHWIMYSPVVGGPVIGFLTIALVFYPVPLLRSITIIMLLVGAALGVTGGYLHFNGIGERVGGYGEAQNYLVGPPLILPLMISAMCLLGLIALYWR
ncbi:hypothetical protein [Desulforamulus ferrireducens]|uniref:Uncharacterized protein n=1 Tax=Desulforamulus ferrireducens TaxID=1833852 RepID=A0A1S6IWP1_9FIRM|nr:hypothetical protein [Desulforamulus ferrireducens]AQS59188.1 hypothetical protein B0537_08920 [Desulforamulus ferrireducens]